MNSITSAQPPASPLPYIPVVDCHQVFNLVQHAQRLPSAERLELLADLERDPDVGPLVVFEVRAHLQHKLS
jgi:hypothetical protein